MSHNSKWDGLQKPTHTELVLGGVYQFIKDYNGFPGGIRGAGEKVILKEAWHVPCHGIEWEFLDGRGVSAFDWEHVLAEFLKGPL
jgi:hypothetical protein